MPPTTDIQKMHDAIAALPTHCEAAWEATRAIRIPASWQDTTSVLLSGMGGSGLAGHVVASSFADSLAVPVLVLNDYHLPAFVGTKTLVIALSYSGQTEETLATYREARARKCRRAVITTGGILARYAKEDGVPRYIFSPLFSSSQWPRIAGGHLLTGLLGLLSRAGLLTISSKEFERALSHVRTVTAGNIQSVPLSRNRAKTIARELVGRIPVVVGPADRAGNLHTWRNCFHETAKTFSAWFALPELNHHLLEGLGHPREARRLLRWVGIEPKGSVLRLRYRLTKKIVENNGMRWIDVGLTGSSKLEQILELLSLSYFSSYYLGIEQRENPSPTPWVDYFKRQLERAR